MCIYHNYLELLHDMAVRYASEKQGIVNVHELHELSQTSAVQQPAVVVDIDMDKANIEISLHDLHEQATMIRNNFATSTAFDWNLTQRGGGRGDGDRRITPLSPEEEVKEFRVENLLFRNKKAIINEPLWKRILLFFAQFLPVLVWLPQYFKKDVVAKNLRGDLIAGITVAIVIIPQAMGYALVAGMPPINGLYTCFLPTLIYPIFGTSRQLAPGPSAIVSLLLSSAITNLQPATTEEYVNYAILLCLLAGGGYFLLGFFRMGFLVNFMSQPVLSGFTSACAISIAMTQIKYCIGVHPQATPGTQLYWSLYVYGKAIFTPSGNVHDTGIHWPTTVAALFFFVFLIFFNDGFIPLGKNRRFYPGKIIPGQLVVVVIALFSFYLLSLADPAKGTHDVFGIEILGSIKTGIPAPSIPKFYTFVPDTNSTTNSTLAPGEVTEIPLPIERAFSFLSLGDDAADPSSGSVTGHYEGSGIISSQKLLDCVLVTITVIIVGFSEVYSVDKFYATQNNYRIDANQELIALGICATLAGFFQAYPASTSFSRSAVNAQVGAQTQMASFITGLCMFLVLTVITPLFFYLPKPFLGALIIIAVSHLLDWSTVKATWRTKRRDTLLLAVAFLATLFLGVEWGIVVAVFISLALVIFRTARPRFNELGRMPGTTDYFSVKRFPKAITLPHILIMRFDSDLSFTNVAYFSEKIERYCEKARKNANDVYVYVLDMTGVNQIDSSGVSGLISMNQFFVKQGIKWYFAETKVEILRIMTRGGVIEDKVIPETHMYHSLHDAVLQAKHDVREIVHNNMLQDEKAKNEQQDQHESNSTSVELHNVVVDDDIMSTSTQGK
jgi:MFS superfamily sulfate permease-like transporter